jgi:hypothetical protein
MSDTAKSKFVLALDSAADEVNRRPNLKGEYRLEGAEGTVELALWGNVSPSTGKLYARGKATPQGVGDAIRAKAFKADVQAPKGIDLKSGEAVLFENPTATAENKQPTYYGYAREAGQFVRLSGWQKGNVIVGTAQPYRPKKDNTPETDSFEPN